MRLVLLRWISLLVLLHPFPAFSFNSFPHRFVKRIPNQISKPSNEHHSNEHHSNEHHSNCRPVQQCFSYTGSKLSDSSRSSDVPTGEKRNRFKQWISRAAVWALWSSKEEDMELTRDMILASCEDLSTSVSGDKPVVQNGVSEAEPKSAPAQGVDSEKGVGLAATISKMSTVQQLICTLALYFVHLTFLTQQQVVFPVQLFPNAKGHFTAIGLDSVAGIFSLWVYSFVRKRREKQNTVQQLPALLSEPLPNETPWKLPESNVRVRLTSLIAAVVLVQTYFFTGRFSVFWEDTLYTLSGIGFPITAPMFRSLCILTGHLSWLAAGTLILRWLPRPPRFFDTKQKQAGSVPQKDEEESFRWFKSNKYDHWLWWVVGGYFVSSAIFNAADLANQFILPASVIEGADESVVTQLVNPEYNAIVSSIVGYIAPCITAPWWEEILYRGFALPCLTQLLGYKWAVLLQGIIFSAHHMSLVAALPLASLGWTWAILYTKSQNLWTVILIHALWNSRVFLGGWFGL